jgi:CRISPR-associated protein Csm3
MYGKIKISADLTVLTGMHIGGSNLFSAIGAVDSPVILDAYIKRPIIPGSSLKGKLRNLLVRSLEQDIVLHGPDEDTFEVKRLFGSTKGNKEKKNGPLCSRLQFCDAFLKNAADLQEVGLTEVKFENTINRFTAVANPRQIERVIRGAVFDFVVVYDMENPEEFNTDFENFSSALKLLQMDYLGGHGTRGYGKVKFSNFVVEPVVGDIDSETTQNLTAILKDVEKDELLPL